MNSGQVILNSSYKLWCGIFPVKCIPGGAPTTGSLRLEVDEQGWDYWRSPVQKFNEFNEDSMAAFAIWGSNVSVVHTLHDHNSNPSEDSGFALISMRSTNQGIDWGGRGRASDWADAPGEYVNPTLIYDGDGRLHLLFDDNNVGVIQYRYSSDGGTTWSTQSTFASGAVSEPCIAALGDFLFGCCVKGNTVVYRYSTDRGANWVPGLGSSPYAVPFFGDDVPSAVSFARPNVTLVTVGGRPGILLVARVKVAMPMRDVEWSIRGMSGRFIDNSTLVWSQQPAVCIYQRVTGSDDPLNPSIAAIKFNHGDAQYPNACYVASVPYASGRYLVRRGAFFGPCWQTIPSVEARGANTARLLGLDADRNVHYAAAQWPYYEAGEVFDQWPFYFGAGMGVNPALALDGDENRWVAFVWRDSLYCMCAGDYVPRLVFAGSTSAVPGQPSIVCYPGQAGGVYVGNVVFAVYDTAGGASKIMYARVDTSAVVLDTIESVANLRDSLPSINVFKSDTLICVFQHGDSVLSVMLADYGPGTAGQVPAWSSPSLVTASGYHPMSVMENGSVLNCAYTAKSGNNYSVQRATNDLAGGMFGSWTAMASPSGSSSSDKPSSVYAGAGVSVWQEMAATGKWVIRGMARGDTMTFVANDTDAYHPHAVAESSAISPSIDQLRAYVLYTAGVTFEVDSGVYDTGETRLFACSLNVSHAGSDATKCNNGAKLVRQNGSDSLYAVYSDADGAVAYAWSAAGDSWRREIMASGREYPAVAEDSSGKRWVVMRKPGTGMLPPIQEAYYRNGSSWTGPETLYSLSGATLGPASLSGSSYTQSGIAYAAFLCTASGGSQSIILAKFNGSVVSTYTVGTGSALGDPTLTVEPYLADSDHVHVTWTDNGTLKYRMDTDGRSTSIASNWTSTYDLTGRGIVAQHLSINSDADQIVVAWAQGSPTDVYACKRSTDSAYNNWEAALNLSNTAQDASDWPVIAMGDTVVVAWEEQRTGGSDFDILASIDFGDTLNIADNATFSTYPHVLFQNKASGDTAIPYLHTIWSETPSASYYEVGYNKLNLKQASGGGQQSASSIPIPTKPSLAACSPNPFRDRTQISYALPAAGNVSLRVYDVTGRTVRTLASGHQKAGSYSVSWDSKDSRGRQVARGVYFYRLDTPGFRAVKKAVVTR